MTGTIIITATANTATTTATTMSMAMTMDPWPNTRMTFRPAPGGPGNTRGMRSGG